MTYYSYEKLKDFLDKKGVNFIEPTPNCPKHLNSYCLGKNGNCAEGNTRNCSQDCSFMYDKRFYKFHVLFSYKINDRIGFVRKEDLCIKNLIYKNIISESDLVAL